MMGAMAYPVSTDASSRSSADRNRLTTAFRLILAIPHLILVGGVGAGFAFHSGGSDTHVVRRRNGHRSAASPSLLAIISWFTIVLHRRALHAGIRRYTRFYLRWRVRALAYLMLLADQYPPFGDGAVSGGADVRRVRRSRAIALTRRLPAAPRASRISSCCSS